MSDANFILWGKKRLIQANNRLQHGNFLKGDKEMDKQAIIAILRQLYPLPCYKTNEDGFDVEEMQDDVRITKMNENPDCETGGKYSCDE